MSEKNKQWLWSFLFASWALHGILEIVAFAGKKRFWLIGIPLIVWIVLALFLFFTSLYQPKFRQKLILFIRSPFSDFLFLGLIFSLVLLVYFWMFVQISEEKILGKYRSYLLIASPFFSIFLSILFGLLLIFILYRLPDRWKEGEISGLLRKFIILVSGVGALAGLALGFGLGIKPVYRGDWGLGLPAVPLLEWQIFIGLLVLLGGIVWGRCPEFWRKVCKWLATMFGAGVLLLWIFQPVTPHFSALPPRAPNYEIYPFGDAKVYDLYAQSTLIGNGYGDIPPRPLYIVFLTISHLLFGQDYNKIIKFQTVLLVSFPILLYFFGKTFFGRPIGLALALLVILRDLTSNLVAPFTGNLSYSKVLLSELPTATIMVIWTFLAIKWLRYPGSRLQVWLLGGILGIAMLFRTQAIVAFPLFFLFAKLQHRTVPFSFLLRRLPLFLVSMLIVISPWLVRNWKLSGQLLFDSPRYQASNLALRYWRLHGVEVNILPQPGESLSEYNSRIWQMAREAIFLDLGKSFRAVFSYFLNHLVNNVLVFPVRQQILDPSELIFPKHAFWEIWIDHLHGIPAWLFWINVLLLTLGIAAAWQRNGWIGLFPLAINMAYNLWTSTALLSGLRFMLTMDWTIISYYLIGLFSVLLGMLYLFRKTYDLACQSYHNYFKSSSAPTFIPERRKAFLASGILFAAFGILPVWIESVFPTRYPLPISLDDLKAAQSTLPPNCLERVLADARLIQGRALYPRFYQAGEGETFTDAAGYRPEPFSRLVFELIGEQNRRVIFPISAIDFFPNFSDVALAEKSRELWVIFLKKQDGNWIAYPSSLFSCP